jgi:hypothetical protein
VRRLDSSRAACTVQQSQCRAVLVVGRTERRDEWVPRCMSVGPVRPPPPSPARNRGRRLFAEVDGRLAAPNSATSTKVLPPCVLPYDFAVIAECSNRRSEPRLHPDRERFTSTQHCDASVRKHRRRWFEMVWALASLLLCSSGMAVGGPAAWWSAKKDQKFWADRQGRGPPASLGAWGLGANDAFPEHAVLVTRRSCLKSDCQRPGLSYCQPC